MKIEYKNVNFKIVDSLYVRKNRYRWYSPGNPEAIDEEYSDQPFLLYCLNKEK